MQNSNRRIAKGSLMPNIYFLLQVGVVFLVSLIALEVVDSFSLSTTITYAIYIVSLIAILYCFVARLNIIARQREQFRRR